MRLFAVYHATKLCPDYLRPNTPQRRAPLHLVCLPRIKRTKLDYNAAFHGRVAYTRELRNIQHETSVAQHRLYRRLH